MRNTQLLVDLYLEKARQHIEDGHYTFETADKRRLTELGISYQEALRIIMSLTSDNYVSGPKPDHLIAEQSIYEFGYDYDDMQIYIKLTFRIKHDLFIMSFHQAKYEMNYPLKK